MRIFGTMGFLESQQRPVGPMERVSGSRNVRKPGLRDVSERYLDQQLEARDSLERQDEEGGEGQPLALRVELQLRDQLPEGCLLLAGDTDVIVSLWLAGGISRRSFLHHNLVGTRQPTARKTRWFLFYSFSYGK